jgi:hypothetical protein
VSKRIRNGVLAALAAVAAMYALGAVGLAIDRLGGRTDVNPALAVASLAAAVGLGLLVLVRHSPRAESAKPPGELGPVSRTGNGPDRSAD